MSPRELAGYLVEEKYLAQEDMKELESKTVECWWAHIRIMV